MVACLTFVAMSSMRWAPVISAGSSNRPAGVLDAVATCVPSWEASSDRRRFSLLRWRSSFSSQRRSQSF
jgi:hypothetical protein